MAKREQVVMEAVEETAEETVRSIAQAQADYQRLMDEIRDYCQRARLAGARGRVVWYAKLHRRCSVVDYILG